MVQVGADIVKRALSYPLKLIAKNAGVNGSVVSEKVKITAYFWYFWNTSLVSQSACHDLTSVFDRFCPATIQDMDTMLLLENTKI